MSRPKPLQVISQWSGFLNNFPITVLLRVFQKEDEWLWFWEAELYWESQHAIENHLETGPLWGYFNRIGYDSGTESHRAGERWIRIQGFQFLGEIQ